ncbi:MAG TPA: hypothetical protein VMR95_03930 [Candidatus Binatia bacterium]|jgi:hypothetical protein|nr:hypothetical protein [Candidatus Binatia bacterium]
MAKPHKKTYISVAILLVIAAAGVTFGFIKYHDDNLKTKNNLAVTNPKAVIKVKASTSTPQAPAVATTTGLTPGGVVDKNGQTTGSLPPSSDWVSSASGDITLQQPSPNTTVNNGDPISGTANVSNVSFILTDNSVGLIDQGNLNVVNGKFSGLLEFQAHSSSGILQLYYPNPSNGSEEDIIEIDVNFNN